MKEFLWIIGNGFDIATRLDTSYRSFLDTYVITPSNDEDVLKFKDDIKKERLFNIESWADLERKLGIITENKNYNDVSVFLKCYYDIRENLLTYLKHKEKHCTPDYSNIKKYFDNIEIEKTIFIVLNYTNNFEKFIREIYPDSHPTILYPHGTLRNNDIVLGVGINTHIKNREFSYNKTIQSEIIKTNLVNYTDLLYPLYPLPEKIRIFGASVGFGDGRIWTEILNSTRLNPNSSSMISLLGKIIFELVFGANRDSENIIIYNTCDNLKTFQCNFAVLTGRGLFVSNRVKQANKRMSKMKYIDSINNVQLQIPQFTVKEYVDFKKSTKPW